MATLDDQQRTLLREALQKEQDPLRVLEEKLRVAQKELMQAVLAEKYEDTVVREKAEAVAKIEVEITMLRGKALATVAPTLKPEQKESMINSPFGTMMLRGGFGGGGFGGGGFTGGGQGGPGGQAGPVVAPDQQNQNRGGRGGRQRGGGTP